MKINELLVKPVLTEKATNLASKKVYSFEVSKKANKSQVTMAVEKIYGVKVAGVRMVIRPGKVRRIGRKMTSKKLSDRKIAYISLSEGKIDLFPQA